jgi:DUF4097 and DUF4098 domain-containing protein YvlB
MSIQTLVVVGLLASAPVFAATPIEQSRPLAADGRVSIENLKGRIVVRTWAQPKVRIAGRLGKGVEKLLVEGDARSLRIEVEYPDQNCGWKSGFGDERCAEPSDIEVTVPSRASLDIESVSATIDVQQMAGRELSAQSVSGDIVVSASSPGEASFENVSGTTSLRITTAKVEVDSVSGDISLQGGLSGEVNLESVSGKTTLIAPALERLELSTVSGSADMQVGLKPGGAIKAETVSGVLNLALPKSTNAKLHAESFSGDIASSAGRVEKEEYGPGRSLDVRLGTGDGKIQLESFSGDVRVRM